MKKILFAGLIGIWATGAMAHSPLDGTTPVNEATVTEMPTEVLMDFNHPLIGKNVRYEIKIVAVEASSKDA